MREEGCIYKITSPSGKIYVGQTRDLKRRTRQYRNLNCKCQTKLYRSLVKYGWAQHKFEVIEAMILDYDITKELNDLEVYWMTYYDCIKSGLNCREGGDSRKASPETLAKMSASWTEERKQKFREKTLGRKHSPDTIEKMKGRKMSDENKKKISTRFKGTRRTDTQILSVSKPKSEEHKAKLSNNKKGRPWTEARRQAQLDRKNKINEQL